MYIPTNIDSTMFSSFSACPRQFEYQFLLGLIRKGIGDNGGSVHTSFGAAFAAGVEEMRKKAFLEGETDPDLIMASAIMVAIKSFGMRYEHTTKNSTNLVKALILYYQTWPLLTDLLKPVFIGEKMLAEVPFIIPVDIQNIEGEHYNICGTADFIGRWGTHNFVVDEKTCSSLGPTWNQQWELRGQFSCYAWAMQQYGIPVAGVLVRGICLKKEIELTQAHSFRTEEQIQEWFLSKRTSLLVMNMYHKANYWPQNFGDACTQWGGCRFRELCLAKPAHREFIIESEYDKKRWDIETKTWQMVGEE